MSFQLLFNCKGQGHPFTEIKFVDEINEVFPLGGISIICYIWNQPLGSVLLRDARKIDHGVKGVGT